MPETQQPSSSAAFHAVAASFLGWTLDAFDFFVVVFLYDTLAAQFHVSKLAIISTVSWTLLMRPVGALIFGLLADRYGRRNLLIANVIFFSVIELSVRFRVEFRRLSFSAHSLWDRHGRRMGRRSIAGDGGHLESLARHLERDSAERLRGRLLACGGGLPLCVSGVGLATDVLAGRSARAAGACIFARSVPESEAWRRHRAPSTSAVLRIVGQQWKLCIYLVFLMTFMMFLSHGTQDLYPDFLRAEHGASVAAISYIVILGNIGAVVGGIIFGQLSNVAGRRLSLVLALMLSLAVMPCGPSEVR